MATNFNFTHEFDTDPATFWKMFFNPEFNVGLYKALNMKSHSVVKQEDDGKILNRIVKLEPSTSLPGFLSSFVKSTGYNEIDRLDWSKNAMDVTIDPDMMKDKFECKGVFSVTPLGDKRIRRDFKGTCKVSIPLIGGKAEKFMVDEMQKAYEAAAQITRKWLAEHK